MVLYCSDRLRYLCDSHIVAVCIYQTSQDDRQGLLDHSPIFRGDRLSFLCLVVAFPSSSACKERAFEVVAFQKKAVIIPGGKTEEAQQ